MEITDSGYDDVSVATKAVKTAIPRVHRHSTTLGQSQMLPSAQNYYKQSQANASGP